MYDQILQEISGTPFYKDNFANDGQRFVAWYLHRVLLLDILSSLRGRARCSDIWKMMTMNERTSTATCS
jgi:hypothetical protein